MINISKNDIVLSIVVALLLLIFIRIIYNIAIHKEKTIGKEYAYKLSSLMVIIGFIINIFLIFNKVENIGAQLLQYSSIIIAIITFSCQKVLTNIISGIMLVKKL